MRYQYGYDMPVGKIYIVESDKSIEQILFFQPNNKIELKQTALINEVARQLREYFNRQRQKFDLPLKMIGTPFQIQVWQALKNIPYGETRTYKQIAEAVGNPKSYRAVGGANNKNPLPIVVPCHRVIGTNGKLIGFAGGLEIKKYLLDLEVCSGD